MLRSMYPFLTHRESELALKACGGDEDEAAEKLTVYDFLHDLRKQVAIELGRSAAMPRVVTSRLMAPTVEGCIVARNRKVGEATTKKKMKEGTKRMRLDDALKAAQSVRGPAPTRR